MVYGKYALGADHGGDDRPPKLHEIQQDPKRAIRKLVDLGMETSGGDLQKSFMGTAQRMLMNEDSPYYDLALDLVQRVDHERILKFGVNLGWNSLTEGAARIRELEAARGHNIPWSMTFHISEGPDALTEEEYRRLVSEGMELGIYSYFLMPEDDASVYKAVDLAGACRNCAFFLLVPGGCDWESGVSSLLSPANLMLGVDFGGSDWEMRVKQLQQQKASTSCTAGIPRKRMWKALSRGHGCSRQGRTRALGWCLSTRPILCPAIPGVRYISTRWMPGWASGIRPWCLISTQTISISTFRSHMIHALWAFCLTAR